MNNDRFESQELKEPTRPAFVNGDDDARNKVLTDKRVATSALRAVFRDRPSYFSQQVAAESR